MELKQCVGCGNFRKRAQYYRSHSTQDGLNRYCKHCCKVNRALVVRRDGRSRGGYGGRVRVMVQPGEAYFVIDDRQRIVEWSYAASVLLGVKAAAALGQPCYKLVHGYDSFGKAVCFICSFDIFKL